MSDQAPERIWLGRDTRYVNGPFIKLTNEGDDEAEPVEYLREDTVYTRAQVEAMVAEERERCAQIADHFRDTCGECPWPEEAVIVGSNVANDIAAAIRAQGEAV